MRALWQMPELQEIWNHIETGETPVTVTGLSPVHRAQLAAALRLRSGRPLLMLCSDEREVQRQAADLACLTGEEPVVLPGHEWQLRPVAAVSRQWECRRLEALHRCASGAPVVVTTAEALAQRCIPPQVLERAALTLEVGGRYDAPALAGQLTDAGYARCDRVEGPGQFAMRGGILDVFSPGMEKPVRCEFFDDEIDSLGEFELDTQRRSRNLERALLLPAAEVLPALGDAGAAEKLERIAAKLEKKGGADALVKTLRGDAESLRRHIVPSGSDRVLAAVYPQKITAADYLAPQTIVVAGESGRIAESLKGFLWQLKEDASTAFENGWLAGELAELAKKNRKQQ